MREDAAIVDKGLGIDLFIRISVIAIIAYWSYELILPFLGLLTWGCLLAIALYPAYSRVNKRIGNHPTIAACLITALTLIIIIGMLSIITNNMLNTISVLRTHTRPDGIPLPPDVIKTWPVIGENLYIFWDTASTNLGALINKYSGYIVSSGTVILSKFAVKTFDFLVFIVSILFAGYLLAKANFIDKATTRFAERLVPKRGTTITNIIKETVRSVSVGVIGIALLQTFLFGVLLFLFEVPGAGLLTLIGLVLCIAQLGLIILIIPVIIWLVLTYSLTLAVLYSILITLTGFVDVLLKPIMLAHGLNTPMVLIFIGVLGGLFLHGLIGIFIGPVILAVFYDLLIHWLDAADHSH